jgi:hypothetical protein
MDPFHGNTSADKTYQQRALSGTGTKKGKAKRA